MAKDFYEIIGLTPEEKELQGEEFTKTLKDKFRKASLKYHPDRYSGKSEKERKEAEEKFKEIAEAYEVLNDPQKRSQYDRFGTVDGSGFSNMDINDLFERFFHDGFFGHSARTRTERAYKGGDKTIRVGITLSELYDGGSKTIRYRKYVPCSHCNGKGSKSGQETSCPYCHGMGQITETRQMGFGYCQTTTTCPHCGGSGTALRDICPHCYGEGVVEQEVQASVPIPSVSKFNTSFIRRGEGNACFRGKGSNGDLYITYRLAVDDNDDFTISPDNPYNLITNVDVPLLDCLLGGDFLFKHINGVTLKARVNSCTSDGEAYNIAGYGLKRDDGQRGSLIVIIHVLMPKSLTDSDITLLGKLKKSKSFQ